LPERPTPDAVAAILKQHQVTCFYAVPTFYAAFLASAAAPAASEPKLRRCVSAGEALPPEIGRRWRERYGVDILDGLGSPEMRPIFLSTRPDDVKYGTTGKPVPGYAIRLSTMTARSSPTAARWASCKWRVPPARSCTGTIASSRARHSLATGPARA